MSEQETVASEQSAITREEAETSLNEKLVPVGEAIRYRKRAQAAEKELSELKQSHEKQGEELAALKESEATGVSGRSEQSTAAKTQGVRETRTGGARTQLQTAAKQAASSGSRSDVQEYLRIRRSFV
ncbi:MAG: hypothetical protein H8E17_02630 [Deltaproteobacteria bacterium]|nr:hypothetical protein [Deltaproteobacteria bacterium]